MMDVFEDPDSTQEEILAAAYRALCAHGYAKLTMERIGEEFEKSVSLVYHHYDGKDDLLLACLEFMLDNYREDTCGEPNDPRTQLEGLYDRLVLTDVPPEGQQFVRVLIELRGQAPHNESYREYFTRSDEFFQDRIERIIETGIETGAFQKVDPERTAEMIHTVFLGALFRYATSNDREWVDNIRSELQTYNERTLYRQDGDTGQP